ncbi:MAG: glycosyltransferase family 4 protein [Actinomycetota bacterium]|nr:glycosyltransferase family 4 protein [Actinomycetota bacterium]
MEVPRTLVVTNDFPPRVGGVQQYVFNVVRHLPPERVAVVAPNWPGWREHDAALPFPVYRFPPTFLWPTGELAAKVRSVARENGSEVVLFGHGLPLGLLGPGLERRGLPYVVATHGAEYWFALLPGLATGLRVATSRASRVLAISRFTARVVRTAVPLRVPVSLLPPGVDPERFRPDVSGQDVRRAHGLGDRPLVVCVSRLVPRKGQDVLIRAMPRILRRVPDAVLLIVGGGPDRPRLEGLAAGLPPGSVAFAGEVPDADLPAHYAAGDVFAMPCRSRLAGLEVEGFGIVFLEAAATGKPVVAGDSGGAAEAVQDGETGLVVDGRHEGAVAEAVAALLSDPARAADLGKAGRARVDRWFTWPRLTGRLARWLAEASR